METVKISDFLYQGESIFGVSNSFYLSLYNFFKTHTVWRVLLLLPKLKF